jgi:hypothetical protein
MQKLFILLLVTFSAISSNAQNLELIKTFGGNGNNGAASIEQILIDSNDNMISTGLFWGTVDFDPGAGTTFATSGGFQNALADCFIQKLDANGDFLWALTFGGSSQDMGDDLCTDDAGNIYFTGYFDEVFNLGINSTLSNGANDIFIAKIDPNGNTIWAKIIGGNGNDYATGIALDHSGNLYISGSFRDTVDFDPGTAVDNYISNGSDDAFLLKLDTAGNYQWTKTFGGSSSVGINAIAIDSVNNIITAGYYLGTVDFDPSMATSNSTSNGNSDAFIQKFDSTGNLLWNKTYGGNGSENNNEVHIANQSHIYITGFFQNTVDFDPSSGTNNLSSNGDFDAFVQKLDLNGNFVWAKSFGGPARDFGYDLSTDNLGNITIVGEFRDTVDLDPGPTSNYRVSNGGKDLFVQQLDANGNFLWSNNWGASSNDEAKSILINSMGEMLIAGYINDSVDFDNGPSLNFQNLNAGRDAFIMKLSNCASIDQSLTPSGLTLTANVTADSYQWVDCDNGNSIIPGETNQSFTPSSTGNYSVMLTDNGCTTTSSCTSVLITALEDVKVDNIRVFPNPAHNELFLEAPNEITIQAIEILNINGQVIRQINANTSVIDVNELTQGIYILRVSTSNSIMYKRFVKR